MLEEIDKEEISKKFFGSKQNIATIAVITVDTNKGKNFETTFAEIGRASCRERV